MENITSLKDYFSSPEEWESLINSINTRSITNKVEKEWFKKIKKYYKDYGWAMNFFEGQYKRLLLIKETLEKNARSN